MNIQPPRQQRIKISKEQFEEIAGKYMAIISNPQVSQQAHNNAMMGLTEFQNRYTYK